MVPPPLLLAAVLAAPVALPADTLVDVGDYALHVEVIRGERPVAFVLEEGGGARLNAWIAVLGAMNEEDVPIADPYVTPVTYGPATG